MEHGPTVAAAVNFYRPESVDGPVVDVGRDFTQSLIVVHLAEGPGPLQREQHTLPVTVRIFLEQLVVLLAKFVVHIPLASSGRNVEEQSGHQRKHCHHHR